MFPKVEENALCDGCLSYGRKIAPVGPLQPLFCHLLRFDEVHSNFYNSSLLLCWECRKMLQNTLKFHKRVTHAQAILYQATVHGNQIQETCFSSLAVSYKDTSDYNIVYNDTSEIQDMDTKVFKTEIEPDLESESSFNYRDDLDLQENEVDLKKDVLKQKKSKKVKKSTNNINYVFVTEKKENAFRKVTISTEEWKSIAFRKKKNDIVLKGLKCKYCAIQFPKEDGLVKHKKLWHDPRKKEQCEICHKRYSDAANLDIHRKRHTVKYVCNICDYESTRSALLRKHLAAEHKKAVKCLDCERYYKNKLDFSRHQRLSHSNYVCHHCGKIFRSREPIIRHMQKHHTIARCQICDITFKAERGLKEHIKLKHTIKRSEETYCVECDKSFDNMQLFRRHLTHVAHKAPVKRSVPCPDCGKVFAKPWNLRNHRLAMHEHRADYRCDHCDKSYVTSFRLRTHVASAHLHLKPPKKFTCQHCGRSFATQRILVNHIRTHTGERPYACAQCPARFAQSAALVGHAARLHKLKCRYKDGALLGAIDT